LGKDGGTIGGGLTSFSNPSVDSTLMFFPFITSSESNSVRRQLKCNQKCDRIAVG
jgi:hypothetical protein